MKKKNIIIFAGISAVTLSAAVFCSTRGVKDTPFANGTNEVGTFTVNETTNNVWAKDWEFYEIVSDRDTTGSLELCAWHDAQFSKKEGAFASVHLTGGEDIIYVYFIVKGVTSISWEFDKDVNFSISFLNEEDGFSTEKFKYSKKTGTWNMSEATFPKDDSIESYIIVKSSENGGAIDFDILSITVTYNVNYCLDLL